MANTKSADKRARQSVKRRDRNRATVSRLRTAVKKVRLAVENGDAAAAKAALPAALATVDASAGKGVIHRNTADRTKSRLTRAVAKTAK